MLTDLVQIRRLGEKKRGENEKFRRHLKTREFAERRLRRIAEEIEEQIDCTTCANCCRVATVTVTERDAEKLSSFLGLRPEKFLAQYTTEDPEEGVILRRTEQGCVFLNGNDCTVYEARPRTCVDFPHLVRGAGSIASRMWQFIDRACYCPIVYNGLEAFKDHVGFKR
ncbi:MAG: YkgJ family cysteine cluster protein [Bryobacteraceae bacterium]